MPRRLNPSIKSAFILWEGHKGGRSGENKLPPFDREKGPLVKATKRNVVHLCSSLSLRWGEGGGNVAKNKKEPSSMKNGRHWKQKQKQQNKARRRSAHKQLQEHCLWSFVEYVT
ncbi:hypothetical protein QOT17_25597 [Balamuthia mandrillaris]